MLKLLLGKDWISNRDYILNMIAEDVRLEKGNRIFMVPELISHDTERRLCAAAGDSVSRFAEVLSFTQLCRRVSDAVGIGMQECLDNGGRLVAMASAVKQLHSKLKAYASVETRPAFLDGLVNAIDEFKRCCITGDDLSAASKQSEGVLAQKLEELSYIMQAYDGLCENGLRDPSSLMTWLLEQLEDSTYAQEHVFYIDGFPDFTRQHMLIVEHFIRTSDLVVIGLNCDVLDTANPAFEKAADTAAALLRAARESGVACEVISVEQRIDPLSKVRGRIYRGEIYKEMDLVDKLYLQLFNSVYEECLAAAGVIMDGVRKGDRYRDFAVVAADIQAYQGLFNQVCERCGIPLYQSGTEDILEMPVISAILIALDAALNGFEQYDVLRYMKSVLSPLNQEICDRVENYCIMWSIDGNRWKEEWTNHPGGLDADWDEASRCLLADLNAARGVVIDPLVKLSTAFHSAISVAQQVDAIYTFLEDIQLSNQLTVLAERFETLGDYRNAQILEQLWDILITALDQMQDVLGKTSWNQEAFGRLLRLLLSQYDVGTIPHVLDSVILGPVSAMRCQQTKHLIILGALEGQFPGYSGSAGILTDHERVALRKLGVPLTGGAMEGVQAELAEIYGVFCGAEETIHIFCSAGQPSFIFQRLLGFVDGQADIDVSTVTANSDALEGSAYLLRMNALEAAQELGLSAFYEELLRKTGHELGNIDSEGVACLYGSSLNLSASQVDKQANCRLSYFLRYGLNAKERKTISIDPAEFGTYVHAVLENTTREVKSLGGFRRVSLTQTVDIAKKYSQEYANNRFSQIDSKRIQYLFERNADELYCIVQELWEEMQESDFEPVGFEVAFGDGGDVQAIPISGKEIEARLRGFVDRVDIWNRNGVIYYRVVDYKTGRKDFDYCDVFNGYGLQMLLYLFALENSWESILGVHPIPSGVQYFPARMPLITADGHLTDDEITAVKRKQLKRKGLLLHDEDVIYAMENADSPERLCCTRKKDGSLSGDLASGEQLKLLKQYLFRILAKMVDDIASGRVDANPYTRGGSHNACTYCPYGAVCHPASVEGRRNYKAITAQRFWEDIEREMMEHGD